jgi:hypothetical protein
MDARRCLVILWPAFLMAGVLETLVFAVIDPASVALLRVEPLDWPAQAVYTVAFFVFWLVIAASSAITQWLMGDPA